METWIADNWFDLFSAAVAIGTLLFALITLREDTETRRISNLIALTKNHREIWSNIFQHPELGRVLDSSVKLEGKPVAQNEQLFVGMTIQHLSATYQALKSGLSIRPDALGEDVRQFFALPIPKAVWEKIKKFQNEDFVAFVEKCVRGGAKSLKWVLRVLALDEKNREQNGNKFQIIPAFAFLSMSLI